MATHLTDGPGSCATSGAPVSGAGPVVEPVVKLVSVDPGLPRRRVVAEPDTQCDCACYAVEGEALPPLHAPLSFYLELTPLCNSCCPDCGSVFARHRPARVFVPPASALTAAKWDQLLSKIQPYAYRLKLTGGEPTLHAEFEVIVESISRRKIPFTLFTNGRWPAPQRLCALLQTVACFEGFLVSLHGPSPRSHDAFTNEAGSFSETLTNVQTAISAGLRVSLSCIITCHTWNLVDDMLTMAMRLGADSVVFNRYLGPDSSRLGPSRDQLKAAVSAIQALRASGKPVKLGNCLPECFAMTDQAGCLAGQAFFTVDPWGRVRPCNHAPILCGDLLRQSVEEIWHSPNMDRWRHWAPVECQDCAVFGTCRGGCGAQAMVAGQGADPLMSGPIQFSAGPRAVWTFYDQARPVGHFSRRSEEFGTLLISGNRLYPVHRDLESVLDNLNGQSTLRQIDAAYGPGSLALVGALYYQGMVDLEA